jgi:hypothetical protein
MKAKYLWNLDLENIQKNGIEITHRNRRMGIGFVAGINTQDVFKTDTAYLPSRITKMGISLNYRLSNRWQMSGRVIRANALKTERLESVIIEKRAFVFSSFYTNFGII